MAKQQKPAILFESEPLLSMLTQEHDRFGLRIKNGEEAIQAAQSQKKKDRFSRAVREFAVCQQYLERVYLFVLSIPLLLLRPDGRYDVLEGVLDYVLTLGGQGFENEEEITKFNEAKNADTMKDFLESYEQLNEDSGLNDFFRKVALAIQAGVSGILACREAAFKN